MKKSKLSAKRRIPSPFGTAIHKTEWTCAAKVAEWMNDVIKDKNLPLGQAEVETTQEGDRKRVDIILFESPASENVICVIETKQPYFDPFDEDELKEPARKKATKRGAKYFATSNFQHLIWFDTERVNSLRPLEEQIQDKYFLSQIENLDLIEEPRYKNSIISGLERFLSDLYEVHSGKKAKPKQAIDELLIYRLQDKIRRLSRYYTTIIDNRCHKDNTFAKELRKWFISQGWSFAWQSQDFDKAARQTAYLLVNKILFYNVLQAKRPYELDPLEVPASLTKGSILQSALQGYFNRVLKIDYETIYTTDFIDTIAFPDEEGVVKEIRELVDILRQYDFSTLGYDVIGRVFEGLIPQDERHNLGQYFTNPDVVDIILKFCLRHEDDKVLDPACGAGTFLVRAYEHKKLMSQRLKHEQILETLWGNDIAKFPAHLSTINLAIQDLSVDKNYPNILQKDFFNLLSTEGGFELPDEWRRARAKTLGVKEREVTYPRWFHCVVGNPPYTRQEEMPEIAPEVKEYKEGLIDKALKGIKGRKIAEISKRAGIHAYFFVHGTKFLQDGGRFGFIVSNSWLDVDYGKGLQEFFLHNYKIIAIIESKVERWFEEADINTCIVILEKCKDRKERDENSVRFVYLFKPLSYFIPPAQDMWQAQVERLKEIDKLIKTIMAHSEFYQNEELRIFPKSQKELWEEGFDKECGKYVGAKWGKYLRAPEIFFKILERGKGKLVPLKEIAEVRRGFTTGANEFFYLTEEEIKRRGIEREFWMHQDEKGNWIPNYVIKSPRECKSIAVKPKDLKYRVLVIHKDRKDLKGTSVLKYIREGESKGYHLRPTCASRERWYDLGEGIANFVGFPERFRERFFVLLNQFEYYLNKSFYGISIKNRAVAKGICAQLNSTVSALFAELCGRQPGGGGGPLDLDVWMVEDIRIYDPSKLTERQMKELKEASENISKVKIAPIFSELGASVTEEVSLDKVKPDRRELDKIVMGEILGLTDEEQIEVYRAVVDLVKSRIERAKSLGKRRKTKEGIDIDLLVKTVMDKLGDDTLGKFYREKILSHKSLRSRSLPKVSGEVKLEQELFGWRLSSGREHIDCGSETEARYLKVWLEAGLDSVKTPKDEAYLEEIVPELESLKRKIDEVFEDYLGSILDLKLRQRLLHQLWQEVVK
ncbi:MAG: SAM-dependent DNA methyltransferase [Chloroflexi bacterium]|nr:SAM-dependent DNA methyltransferase [Chloroflexota bacterium]